MNRDVARTAAAAIVNLRTQLRPDVPPDVDEDDLPSVAEFVRRHPHPGLAREEGGHEVTILVHLAGELERHLYDAIGRMRTAGATWREVADALRVRSPQAAEQTWLRLVDLYRGDDGTRDHASGRRLRHQRAAPITAPAENPARPARPTDAPHLRQALRDLVALAGTIPDEETAAAVYTWRSEVTELPGGRLAAQVRTLLPLQLDGAELPHPVQQAVDRVWTAAEAVTAAAA